MVYSTSVCRMPLVVAAFLSVAGLAYAEHQEAPPHYRSHFAVVIGADDYTQDPATFPALTCAKSDAHELALLLANEFGYRTHTHSTKNDNLLLLTGKEATQTNISNAFTKWLPDRKIDVDDCLLVYFSGHGIYDAREKSAYIVASDSHRSRIKESCISLRRLRDLVDGLPCRHKLLILDSCFSGNLFRDTSVGPSATRADVPSDGGDPFPYYLKHRAYWGLSAGLNTPVLGRDGRHSILTSCLLAELRERADSRRQDGAFSIRQLAPRVIARATAHPNGWQIPEFSPLASTSDADFLFFPATRRLTPHQVSAHRAYALTMQAIPLIWHSGASELTARLLEGLRPKPGDHDLRGFEWNLWWNMYHGERLSGTVAGVRQYNGVVFSPDGKYFVTASNENVLVWDAQTGAIEHKYVKHANKDGTNVDAIAYSPVKHLIASAHGYRVLKGTELRIEGDVKVYEAKTGRDIASIPLDPGLVYRLSFSTDAEYIAVAAIGCAGKKSISDVSVFSIADQKKVFQQSFETGIPLAIFHPFRHFLAVFGQDEKARDRIDMWDMSTEKARLMWSTTARGRITALAFDPLGSTIAGAGTGGIRSRVSFERWATENGKLIANWEGHTGEVSSIAFVSDGELVSGSEDRSVIMWNAYLGTQIWRSHSHREAVSGVACRPNSNEVVSVTSGSNTQLAGVPGLSQEDIKALLGESHEPELRVWAVDESPAMSLLNFPTGTDARCVAFSPDGTCLAAGCGFGGAVGIWDARTKKLKGKSKVKGEVTGLAYDPSGKRLILGCGDVIRPGSAGQVVLADAAQGAELSSNVNPDGAVVGVAVSTDGAEVAAACWKVPREHARSTWHPVDGSEEKAPYEVKGVVRLYRVDGNKLGEVDGIVENGGAVTAVAYAKDRHRLAWASWETTEVLGRVRVRGQVRYRSDDRGKVITIGEQDGMVRALCFDVTGEHLASAGANAKIIVWNIKTKEQVLTIEGHAGEVTGILYTADNKRIVSCSEDKTVKMWDSMTGDLVGELVGHVNRVSGVAASPDNTSIAASSFNGQVRLWRAIGERAFRADRRQ